MEALLLLQSAAMYAPLIQVLPVNQSSPPLVWPLHNRMQPFRNQMQSLVTTEGLLKWGDLFY